MTKAGSGWRAWGCAVIAMGCLALQPAAAQQAKISKTDLQIDAVDPGIKLFLREKLPEAAASGEDNVVLFLHGATSPSTCDFDLPYKDYSWADWLASRG